MDSPQVEPESVNQDLPKQGLPIPGQVQVAIDRFLVVAESSHNDMLLAWQEQFRHDLRKFSRPVQLLQKRIHALSVDSGDASIMRGWLKALIDDFIQLNEKAFASDLLDEILWMPWLDTFESFSQSVDDTISATFDFENWIQQAPEDGRRELWRTMRTAEKILQKKDQPFERVIHLRGLFQAKCEHTIAEQRSHAWVRLQKDAAQGIQRLISVSLELKLGLRLTDDFDDINDFGVLKIALQKFLEVTDEIEKSLEETVTRETEEFASGLDELNAGLLSWWPYTSTMLLPASIWKDTTRTRNLTRVQQNLRTAVTPWVNLAKGRTSEWKKDLELVELELGNALESKRHRKTLDQGLNQNIRPKLDELKENTQTVVDQLPKEAGDIAKDDLENIRSSTRQLTLDIRRKHMPDLTQTLVHAEIDRLPVLYATGLERLIDRLPEKQVIFHEKQASEARKPRAEREAVELREIIRHELFRPLDKKLAKLSETLRNDQGRTLQLISDLDHLLEVNVSAGLDLLDGQTLQTSILTGEALDSFDVEDSEKATDEALRIIRDGYERLLSRLHEIETRVNDISTRCDNELSDGALYFEASLESLSVNEEILELKLRYAAGLARQRMRQVRRRAAQRVVNSAKLIVTFVPGLVRWIRNRYWGFKELTGLVEASREAGSKLSAFLRETDRAINTLPFVYRQLFRTAPLSDDRFFTAREEEMGVLTSQVALWRDGHLASTALVGELGSGRTSLLFIARKTILNKQTVIDIPLPRNPMDETGLAQLLYKHLDLSKCRTLEDVEESIKDKEFKRTVCVVENLHNLYLRTIDGFDLLERFLLLVNRTGDKVLWLITCNRFAWAYLDKAIKVSNSVQKTLDFSALTPDELRELIRKRHQASGFKTDFEAPQSLKETRRFRKLRNEHDQQEAARMVYFKQLHELSGGNIAAALLFYLRSITVQEDGSMHIAPLTLDETFLSGTDADELFTMAALVQHGALSEDQHAAVFRQSTAASRTMLSRLAGRGIVVLDAEGYRIHPFLYRLATRELKENNLLS